MQCSQPMGGQLWPEEESGLHGFGLVNWKGLCMELEGAGAEIIDMQSLAQSGRLNHWELGEQAEMRGQGRNPKKQ